MKEVLWLIRLHPRMVHLSAHYVNRLEEIGVKFDLTNSTNTDLYELLSNVDINITHWSSVAYEALSFGVHSIIIHENGKEAMNEYIGKGIFHYIQNSEELQDLIIKNQFEKENRKYIETSEIVIKKALNGLVH